MANILLFYIKTTIKIEESKFYVTFIKIPPPKMQTTLCKYYKKSPKAFLLSEMKYITR